MPPSTPSSLLLLEQMVRETLRVQEGVMEEKIE